jgi:hypothetical protein
MRMNGSVFRKVAIMVLAPACLLAAAGCQSFNRPPTNNLSSITITDRTLPQIAGAIQEVFATHYFTGGPTDPYHFTFQRPGTRANNLAYGSVMFDESVTVRVDVAIQPGEGAGMLVTCNAWLVEDEGDPVFEDPHKVRLLRKWPYAELMRDIRKQLGE